MLTTPHVLVGLAIIKIYPHPLGLLFALLSHYLLDFTLPHWNPHIFTEFKKNGQVSRSSVSIILGDGFLAVILTLLIMEQSLPNITLALLSGFGSFLSVLPDAVEIPYYFLGYKSKFFKKYANLCHKYQAGANFFWGMLIQLLVILACLKILFS